MKKDLYVSERPEKRMRAQRLQEDEYEIVSRHVRSLQERPKRPHSEPTLAFDFSDDEQTVVDPRVSREDWTQLSMEKRTEQLLSEQVQHLSEPELLSLVLRTGGKRAGDIHEQGMRIWQHYRSLQALERAGVAELSELKGVTSAKAASILAALELGRRLVERPLYQGQQFICSKQVFCAFAPRLSGLEQETFWVILLNQGNRILKQIQVATGSIHLCPIAPSDLFSPALREKATRLILLHNHPSGDPEPSQQDRTLTKRLQEAARLLGLKILDHLVIGQDCYVSFADRGWL